MFEAFVKSAKGTKALGHGQEDIFLVIPPPPPVMATRHFQDQRNKGTGEGWV